MGLSSILLGSAKTVDSELDSIFKTTPTIRPPPPPAPVAESSKDAAKKRKLDVEKKPEDAPPTKRVRSSPEKTTEKKGKKAKTNAAPAHVTAHKIKKASKGKAKEVHQSDSEEEDNSDLENAYLHGKKEPVPQPPSSESDNDSEGGDPSALVHETLKTKSKRIIRRLKYVPEDETMERRDQRTVFIGNLPIDVAQKKSLLKNLHRHILTFVPTAKIESTRFRSIPFQSPTAKLPTSDDEGDASKSKSRTPTEKQPRQHDRDRMAAWRLHSKHDEEEEVKKDDKKFLNSNQKKKIAFINQEFHSTADTVNAYVVFAHPIPTVNWPANIPPPQTNMDPYEAALQVVEKGYGSMFMERMIRIDRVGKKGAAGPVENDAGLVGTDVKLSVFVGNLDFATKEEDLRVFFEGVVSAERGPPPVRNHVDDGAKTKKPMTWVTRVRIVRDKDTQLGKGFAYVQFADRECVDEMLALEQDKLKFAKRKLRVQRCKSLPGGTGSAASKRNATADGKGPAASKAPRAAAPHIVVPKGDPALGEKLASLSKDERKQAKATDVDRVARRLAKKKARMVMGTGVKPKKDRERVRKLTVDKTKGANPGKKEGKKLRVRSDKSITKRNTKKS